MENKYAVLTAALAAVGHPTKQREDARATETVCMCFIRTRQITLELPEELSGKIHDTILLNFELR